MGSDGVFWHLNGEKWLTKGVNGGKMGNAGEDSRVSGTAGSPRGMKA